MGKFCTLKAIENSKKKKTNGGLSCSCPPKLIYKYDSQSEFQQVFFFLRNWHAESNLNRIEKDLDYPKQFLEKKICLLLDIKTYYTGKRMLICIKDKERPSRNRPIHTWSIDFKQIYKSNSVENGQPFQQMELKHLDVHMQK